MIGETHGRHLLTVEKIKIFQGHPIGPDSNIAAAVVKLCRLS
ncbi:MAG TPA: hypothetical protein VK487_05505 [Candidatus Bathyarchaeia archaeon]|nr:hypothetical protein [Candidatus Bathyarchaeia archaeon]